MNWLAVQFALLPLLANLSYAAQWRTVDMNPGELPLPRDPTSITPDCDGTPCGYNIFYFTSGPPTPGQKTILYISGGPGQIVNRDQKFRDLKELESTFRIVYFDIRGAGLSAPQNAMDNGTDRFLRAKYVLKDIEAIRKNVLVDEAWDAIYGHSTGTVFAQMYAEQFGKITPTNNKIRVKSLILSAPISRHKDNEPARAQQIATNLQNILENTTDAKCPLKEIPESFLERLHRLLSWLGGIFSSRVGNPRSDDFLKATNNFCFLDSTRINSIKKVLENKLNLITKKYGSITFVLEHHEELAKVKADTEFQREFAAYPNMFFFALRVLDRLGSPTQKGSDLFFVVKSLQVDAALILGYYLGSPAADTVGPECNQKAQFLHPLNDDGKDLYCRRLESILVVDKASEHLRNSSRSERAANVLGINEGIHRWPVRLMPASPKGCNRGEEFIAFASNPGNDQSTTARNVAGRVGFVANENICAWDPAKHKHYVPTLILKGSQDAATQGCQAEHFFREGVLHATKEFIELKDLGHDWISEIKPEGKRDVTTLLESFIRINDLSLFRGNGAVKTALQQLGARSRTMDSFAASGC